MTNEEFQALVLQSFKELKAELQELRTTQEQLRQSLARIEAEHGEKLRALYDAFLLRGDQVEQLRRYVEERFESIETDTRYLVARIVRLEKLAK